MSQLKEQLINYAGTSKVRQIISLYDDGVIVKFAGEESLSPKMDYTSYIEGLELIIKSAKACRFSVSDGYLDIKHMETDPSVICDYINDALIKNKIGDCSGHFPGCVTVAFGYRDKVPYHKVKEFILNLREVDAFILRRACSHETYSDILTGVNTTAYSFRLVPRHPSDLDKIKEFIKPECAPHKEMGEQ